MQAVVIDAFGGPERLVPRGVPVPAVGPRDVLVRLDTAGVGVWDAKARRGQWSSGHDVFPNILGAEGSGTIAAMGDAVVGLQVGDAVYCYAYGRAKGGCYAEYAALLADHVAPMPRTLDFREAGAVPVAGITALAGIDDVLALQPGQTLLVHGATAGVGTMAVQFAKRRGARVIATANGGDGVQLLRTLGADEAVDTQRDDALAIARRIAPRGVDAILALAGGPPLEHGLDTLRPGGILAYPNGVDVPHRDGLHAIAFNGIPNPATFARLSAIIDEAPFTVPISATYSLDEAAEAHRRLERGHVLGKIVLVIDATENAVEKVA
jgi:NADPH:quinone reductase-like Zn-dependent oxidoreductase